MPSYLWDTTLACALQRAYDAADLVTDNFIAANSVHLDCCAGCSLCCYLRVDAKAHEILAIAYFVQTRLSDSDRSQLLDRLKVHTDHVAKLSYRQHLAKNVACPLLVDGRCSVYPARPFGCRRHQSRQVKSCQYSFDHPEDLTTPAARDPNLYSAAKQAENSLQSVFTHLSYDSVGYELCTALLEALSGPIPWRRWKSGKKTFLNAVTVPTRVV